MAEVSIRILIMFIWETHKKMPNDLHDRLVNAIGMKNSHYINYDGHSGVTNATYENVQDEFFTSYLDEEFKVEGLMDFYADIVKEMMLNLGIYNRSKYEFQLWTQRYNSDTESHWPHEHFGGCEIISFNHIVDATTKKCFYFLDDEDNKIYPGEQDSGHFFAWPPWRVHGADKVTEPNVNRLIVAGNVSLAELYTMDEHKLTCEEHSNGLYVWKTIDLK